MTIPVEDARPLPHNLEAEKSVLGAILVQQEAFNHAAELIDSRDFFRDAHRRIFDKMVALSERNAPIDFVTLREELGRSGELEDVGGPAYITWLADGVPRSANVAHYAGIVKAHARTRDIIRCANHAITAFTVDPGALGNGAGSRFADAVRRIVDDAHGGSESTVVNILDDVAVVNLPELQVVIEGRFYERTLLLLAGLSGIGKTFVAIDLALSITSRTPWLAAPIVKPGPVLYVAAEGAPAQRIGAWKIAHGFSLDEPLGLHTWPGPVNLMDDQAVSAFIAAARTLACVSVIFDTFSRCFVGGDENSAKDVGRAVANMDRIRVQLGVVVIVLHHLNKGGTSERGSGALRGACDTVLFLQKADDLLQLTCDKQRDAEPFEPINVKLVPAYPGARSCVVRLADDVDADAELSDAQGKALHTLREVFGDGGATSAEWEAAVPTMHRATFYRARTVLITAGYVRQDGSGKRFYATSKPVVARCRAGVASEARPTVAPVVGGVA